MKNNRPSPIHICIIAAGVLILVQGCRLPSPSPVDHIDTKEKAVYTRACNTMATAQNRVEFEAALSTLDSGLDFSKENPQKLIPALGHSINLMKTAELKAKAGARKSRSRENTLKLKIKTLEQTVKTLRHQIYVLENIDQERQEKRKTQ